MKKIFFLLTIVSVVMSCQAQNEKNIVFDANAEVRSIKNFSAIEVSGGIDVYLSQGTEEAVAISGATAEVIERIKTEVKGNTLHIYFDNKGANWRSWGNTKVKAYITFKNLNRIEASGACNIRAAQTIKVSDLKISLSGASDFDGEIDIKTIKLETSGASNIKINGKADIGFINASGACTIKAYDLKLNTCKVEASGASNVRISVNKELNAEASGGSSIFYKAGTDLIRSGESSGGATIKRKADNE